jgi:ankyrin repeat protein
VELARGLLARGASVGARGASVGARERDGCDATYWASYSGNVALVTLLLDHGGDPCTKDKYGWTALMAAAFNGHLAVCLLLLARGADLTAVMHGKCTTLEWYGDHVNPPLSPEVLAEHRAALMVAWRAGPHPRRWWCSTGTSHLPTRTRNQH